MTDLYLELNAGSRPERLDTAGALFTDLAQGHPGSHIAYNRLCAAVIQETLRGESQRPSTKLAQGEFSPRDSAGLVLNERRVAGFLQAIGQMAPARTAIDAGCGSSALLSAGIALQHAGAEVYAYEINEQSVRCARRIVELLGMDDRVSVAHQDVTEIELPAVDIAVTETFGLALLRERGVEICGALGRVARTMVPARVELYGGLRPDGPRPAEWQPAGTVDLRAAPVRISGSFTAPEAGMRTAQIYAAYYADGDVPVLTVPNEDAITSVALLGEYRIPRPDSLIQFSYSAGADYRQFEPDVIIS